MLENLRQRKTLILIILLTLVGLIGAGYLFASKKSEPVYRSKIDKIMYDTKNQSPKYVITLPDREKKKSSEGKKAKQEKEKTASSDSAQEKQDIDDVLKNIPSLRALGDADGQKPLAHIRPATHLVEKKEKLSLPQISGKEKPWEVYGRKVSVMPRFHKVAVIIKNMGMNQANASLINKGLPAEVSFSFSPYAGNLETQISEARTEGHETYTDFLLPSKDYLKSDSGPLSVSLTAGLDENKKRLEKIIGINASLGGVVVSLGIADESNSEQLTVLLQELSDRGLLIIDASKEDGIEKIKINKLARAQANVFIDDDFSSRAIEKKILEAEQKALDNGQVIIIALPKPNVITALSKWIKTFSPQLSYEEMKAQNITEITKPFALVPVSNLIVE